MSLCHHKKEEVQDRVTGRGAMVLGTAGSAVPGQPCCSGQHRPGSPTLAAACQPARACWWWCGTVVTVVPPVLSLIHI